MGNIRCFENRSEWNGSSRSETESNTLSRRDLMGACSVGIRRGQICPSAIGPDRAVSRRVCETKLVLSLPSHLNQSLNILMSQKKTFPILSYCKTLTSSIKICYTTQKTFIYDRDKRSNSFY